MSSPDEQQETIDVPAGAVVQCPLAGFELRQVEKCAECAKFGGLEDRFPGSPAPFAKRYTLKCYGEPVRRVMLMMEKA